ncbi:DegT/DnrJ/EryC1/StrS aminotransferase family protein [Massilia sp. TS11]|uniref:DegT/DnrJ/EryC1/StrS family aminotransferase n=1 Tax=Massilia sp. TS11 TaxID=2908003 RepID=UPI001EDBED95|nr:DegT/DnrJ/EryC1/StrS family aminotransferase [Massilia sp. TS11]MCG2584301.1 DegT/DnrJ/EryC1/StrS family aminotransferase [Massilia sp. TS11]
MEFIDLKTQYRALRTRIHSRIDTVLEHGKYILGPEVAELEAALAAYTGARHCITVASGTEALIISLLALGLQPGDEVITTPFTFIATAEALVLLGGRPVFADVLPDSGLIDPEQIEARITPRTRAILPVSLYGQVADMDRINAIAARHGLAVIEDGAQSFGAEWHRQKSCHLSTIGCTSFFPSKPLGCYGDGGAIFTDDTALATAMQELRIHGQARRYVHTRVGVGGRMDTLQCAIVLAKLEAFDWELAQRRQLAQCYDRLFANHVRTARVAPHASSTYAQYTVLLEERDRVQATLTAAGIPTAIHYPLPINQQPAYAHFDRHDCPVAARLAEQVLSLPMSPYLSRADVNRVANAVLQAVAARPARAAQTV